MQPIRPLKIFHPKLLGCSILVCALLAGYSGIAQIDSNCVVKTALTEVGVQEATGNNDGARIFEYLRAGGMKNPAKYAPKYRAWCMGFVTWVLIECGHNPTNKIKNPLATASWVVARGIMARRNGTPKAGDPVFYNFSGRRAGADHGEITRDWDSNPRMPFFVAVGGNTSNPKRRGRDGVYIKPGRLKRQVTFFYPLKNL